MYADLHGYTEGQDPAQPGEVLEMFLRSLGVPAEEVPAKVEERSGLLRQVLASRRVLMVLDNARTEAQVRVLLPGAGGSLVLVTSRSVLPGLEADERISLDVLTADEAVAMLAGLAGTSRAAADPEAVAEVARLCGRLPLALRIAGQILAAHLAWPVARLARMLAGEQDRLSQLGTGDLQVRTAFEVSYRQLPDADARMFRLLGLNPGPDFDTAAAASLAGIDAEAAGPVLDRLMLASLATEDSAGRFRIHDLLRLFARQTCQEADDQASRDAAEIRLVSYYTDLTRFLDVCIDPRQPQAAAKAAGQAGGAGLAPREALVVFETERPSLLAALDLAAQRGWDEQVWRFSESISGSLTRLRYLDDLLIVKEAALAAARHARNIAIEGRALNGLGEAFRELRRFEEAIGCYQESLTICRESGERHGEGQILNNLGIVYGELRRFGEAVDCDQESLAIFREAGDRHGEGQVLSNLGIVYGELRRYEQSVDCLEESLAIRRRTSDPYGVGQTLNNLGILYGQLRRFEKAIDCYQESLAISRETGNRHAEGLTLTALGIDYWELRRFEEAVDCDQESLAIFRETGDRHDEGMAGTELGNAYQGLGRFEEAVDCYQESLAIFRETGDRHGEGIALNSLGNTYQRLGQFEESIGCYQESLVIRRETGDRHGEGLTLDNLGAAYQGLRQPERAAAWWRDAAVAMRDAGDRKGAARLEQRAANVGSRRRRWRRKG